MLLFLYSCVADNTLGRAKKYMEVSGRPGPAVFHSAPWSRSFDSYNLTWKVESYPPLQEVRLLYRKLMVSRPNLPIYIYSLYIIIMVDPLRQFGQLINDWLVGPFVLYIRFIFLSIVRVSCRVVCVSVSASVCLSPKGEIENRKNFFFLVIIASISLYN